MDLPSEDSAGTTHQPFGFYCSSLLWSSSPDPISITNSSISNIFPSCENDSTTSGFVTPALPSTDEELTFIIRRAKSFTSSIFPGCDGGSGVLWSWGTVLRECKIVSSVVVRCIDGLEEDGAEGLMIAVIFIRLLPSLIGTITRLLTVTEAEITRSPETKQHQRNLRDFIRDTIKYLTALTTSPAAPPPLKVAVVSALQEIYLSSRLIAGLVWESSSGGAKLLLWKLYEIILSPSTCRCLSRTMTEFVSTALVHFYDPSLSEETREEARWFESPGQLIEEFGHGVLLCGVTSTVEGRGCSCGANAIGMGKGWRLTCCLEGVKFGAWILRSRHQNDDFIWASPLIVRASHFLLQQVEGEIEADAARRQGDAEALTVFGEYCDLVLAGLGAIADYLTLGEGNGKDITNDDVDVINDSTANNIISLLTIVIRLTARDAAVTTTTSTTTTTTKILRRCAEVATKITRILANNNAISLILKEPAVASIVGASSGGDFPEVLVKVLCTEVNDALRSALEEKCESALAALLPDCVSCLEGLGVCVTWKNSNVSDGQLAWISLLHLVCSTTAILPPAENGIISVPNLSGHQNDVRNLLHLLVDWKIPQINSLEVKVGICEVLGIWSGFDRLRRSDDSSSGKDSDQSIGRLSGTDGFGASSAAAIGTTSHPPSTLPLTIVTTLGPLLLPLLATGDVLSLSLFFRVVGVIEAVVWWKAESDDGDDDESARAALSFLEGVIHGEGEGVLKDTMSEFARKSRRRIRKFVLGEDESEDGSAADASTSSAAFDVRFTPVSFNSRPKSAIDNLPTPEPLKNESPKVPAVDIFDATGDFAKLSVNGRQKVDNNGGENRDVKKVVRDIVAAQRPQSFVRSGQQQQQQERQEYPKFTKTIVATGSSDPLAVNISLSVTDGNISFLTEIYNCTPVKFMGVRLVLSVKRRFAPVTTIELTHNPGDGAEVTQLLGSSVVNAWKAGDCVIDGVVEVDGVEREAAVTFALVGDSDTHIDAQHSDIVDAADGPDDGDNVIHTIPIVVLPTIKISFLTLLEECREIIEGGFFNDDWSVLGERVRLAVRKVTANDERNINFPRKHPLEGKLSLREGSDGLATVTAWALQTRIHSQKMFAVLTTNGPATSFQAAIELRSNDEEMLAMLTSTIESRSELVRFITNDLFTSDENVAKFDTGGLVVGRRDDPFVNESRNFTNFIAPNVD